MGQGEEVKTREDPKVDIQERGEIFFFYRAKVNKDEAHGPNDVQRLYIVLRPESGEKQVEIKQASDSGKEGQMKADKQYSSKQDQDQDQSQGGHGTTEVNIEKQTLLRLIVMGKKSLPDPSQRSTPYWGYVELITTDVEDIKTSLKGEEYETATRGQRHKPAARAAGEGVYRILKHESGRKTHTHLIYKLELPSADKKNEPQEALNIEREASYVLQIKNPDQAAGHTQFQGLQSKRRAAFPAQLQALLGHRRFAPADPPDLMNYEGCELLLISASDDVDRELGMELRAEDPLEGTCSGLINMFGDDDVTTPLKPLLTGTWD
ncbi:Release factor protein [Dioscorea alata]|uniref:Release factor protein n=1 Tax=Dioscorea alata TaxID=55571 RepID=A0ACB7VD17_DIOAL|nr:Release factor protein [Dioscorea alata]